MDRFDVMLSAALSRWARRASPPAATRARVLQRAEDERNKRWQAPPVPVHLQAWNLPKRNSHRPGFGYCGTVSFAAPLPTGGLKLIL